MDILLKTYFFMSPFAVAYIVQGLTKLPLTFLLQIIILNCLIIKIRRIKLNLYERKTLFLFLFPITLSIINVFFKMLLNENIKYLEYLSSNFINRVILIVLNSGILIMSLSMTSRYNLSKLKNLIKGYYYGISVFLIFGIWQFLSFITSITFLEIDTRNYIHSVGNNRNFLINYRLTSLANEPSYFAPLIIDFIILSFIFDKYKKIKLIIAIFLLIFTYSGGGYLNFGLLVLITICLYSKYKKQEKMKGILLIILLPLITLCFFNFQKIFDPITARMDSIFDLKSHERLYMIIYSFIWIFEEGILAGLVGMGINSFKYLSLTKILPTGKAVHVTSNNLFSDTVYELGYFGLITYIYMFIYLFRIFFKDLKNNKFYFIAIILTCHLAITSLYRGDYMQPRFWIIIFIILKLKRMKE